MIRRLAQILWPVLLTTSLVAAGTGPAAASSHESADIPPTGFGGSITHSVSSGVASGMQTFTVSWTVSDVLLNPEAATGDNASFLMAGGYTVSYLNQGYDFCPGGSMVAYSQSGVGGGSGQVAVSFGVDGDPNSYRISVFPDGGAHFALASPVSTECGTHAGGEVGTPSFSIEGVSSGGGCLAPDASTSLCQDSDADNDGVPDPSDPCPLNPDLTCGVTVPPPTPTDPTGPPPGEGGGGGDPLDPCAGVTDGSCAEPNPQPGDTDGDGVPDTSDNCPDQVNTAQGDLDGDNQGDACDPDTDGDGTENGTDACPLDPANACGGGGFSCADEDPSIQRERLELSYEARVLLAGAPDARLFRFDPRINYCYDGTRALITQATAFSEADAGFDEALLKSFGFETMYDPQAEPDPSGAGVTINGEFLFTFDLTTVLDRTGVSKFAQDKATKQLEKRLTKLLKRYGKDPQFNIDAADAVDAFAKKIMNQVDLIDVTLIDKGVPVALAEALEDAAEESIQKELDAWTVKVKAALTTGAFAGLAAHEIVAQATSWLLESIEDLTTLEFEVWQPALMVTIHPDGSRTLELDGYVHPLLIVTRLH